MDRCTLIRASEKEHPFTWPCRWLVPSNGSSATTSWPIPEHAISISSAQFHLCSRVHALVRGGLHQAKTGCACATSAGANRQYASTTTADANSTRDHPTSGAQYCGNHSSGGSHSSREAVPVEAQTHHRQKTSG